MWILYAFGSAFFAGLTAVLAKCGIEHTNSHLATALRTIVVLVFSWIMVGIVGSFDTIHTITHKTFLFLILSGISTGASWLCYFKALQLGNINKVTAIDKTSVVLTIILSFLFFKESVTAYKIIGMIILTIGTYLMVEKKKDTKQTSNAWLLYALLSVVFASLTTILGKMGITNIESNLGTAIRTSVVLIMSWIVVLVTHSQMNMNSIPKKEYLYIALSGLATGGSWLCFYHALQSGPASLITPIDKLSILFTVLFSYLIFHEKLSKKALFGLWLIVSGTLVMLV
ncbi:MAG: EamA family transporter [Catenibacterium mitsuokai]|nr:EamA family transporter [Catenibacterium mitsuokai]MBN2932852.1 EamA family transporter [Catenibacterium mitsuokai]